MIKAEHPNLPARQVTRVVGVRCRTGFGGVTADPQSLTVDARSEPDTALVQVYGTLLGDQRPGDDLSAATG